MLLYQQKCYLNENGTIGGLLATPYLSDNVVYGCGHPRHVSGAFQHFSGILQEIWELGCFQRICFPVSSLVNEEEDLHLQSLGA